jgi:hypothetical protein
MSATWLPSTKFTDFGSLYPLNLAGDGKVFYCPSLTYKNSILGAGHYEPWWTMEDSSPPDGKGNLRGSYLVNFHNSTNRSPDGNTYAECRKYQRTGDVRGRVVFGMDFIDYQQFDATGNLTLNSPNFAHSRSKGWDVMFSDASVNFVRWPVRQVKLIWLNAPWTSQYDNVALEQFASLIETNNP